MKDTVVTIISYIDARPETVWDALISPKGLWKAWYGAWITSSFKVGEKIEFLGPGLEGEETVHIYGEMLAFDPNKIFSYTEHPGPSYKPDHANLHCRISWNFDPAGECTKLTLVIDQWSEHHYSLPTAFNDWSMVCSILKSFIESGKILKTS